MSLLLYMYCIVMALPGATFLRVDEFREIELYIAGLSSNVVALYCGNTAIYPQQGTT